MKVVPNNDEDDDDDDDDDDNNNNNNKQNKEKTFQDSQSDENKFGFGRNNQRQVISLSVHDV